MSILSVAILSSMADDRFRHCAEIRRTVFQVGQGVSEEREVDGLDDQCIHLLAECDGIPCGTARYYVKGSWAKVERVAVLGAHRGKSVGRSLMSAIEAHARSVGCLGVMLSSQEEVIPFYEALHYRVVGDLFFDADIPHRNMRKRFQQRPKTQG